MSQQAYSNKVQLINGQWQSGLGHEVSSLNPARNKIIWQGKTASPEQVNEAVLSARNAFETWADMPFDARVAIVTKFAELLAENKDALADTIAQETGKPKWETLGEAGAMVAKIAISLKAYKERTGIVENPMPGAKAFIRHKPHGVVAIFGPYNFPGHLPNGHIVPALIAGNTIVFKPSELTQKYPKKY